MELSAREQCRLLVLALFGPSELTYGEIKLVCDRSGRQGRLYHHCGESWETLLEVAERRRWTESHQLFEGDNRLPHTCADILGEIAEDGTVLGWGQGGV